VIRLIAAIDKKRGLAKNGQIPWKLPDDIARFRQLIQTHEGNALMGRKTYELFTSPLKTKHTFILTHQNLNLPKNTSLVNDLDKFILSFKADIWVIGGAEVYARTIKYADELFLTLVEGDFNCDQFFPDYSDFKLKQESGPYHQNDLSFYYQTLTRF
jgi:dihydrofolate reductase